MWSPGDCGRARATLPATPPQNTHIYLFLIGQMSCKTQNKKQKTKPFSELCICRPGFGGYTPPGFRHTLTAWVGHNLHKSMQQPCWSNSFVIRIPLGFYLLHKYLLRAYCVSIVGAHVSITGKDLYPPALMF